MDWRKSWHIILPCFLWIASCLDLGSTLIVLNLDERFSEGNPIIRYAFDEYGQIVTSLIKLTITGLLCVGAWRVLKRRNRRLTYFISSAILVPHFLLGVWWVIHWIFFLFY